MMAMEADYHRHMRYRFIEVSHEIEPGMETYPGLPVPQSEVIWDYDSSRARYEGHSEFFIASLHLCGNTGTYVDSPLHRFRDGADLAGLPLNRLAHLPAVLVDATNCGRAIGPGAITGSDVQGRAVLFRTGFSRYWRTPAYFAGNPFLTRDACRRLASEGALFVGIDSLNIDDTDDLERPAHTILLGSGIPVCEHMTNLDLGPAAGGYLHAVPIAWKGGASFPVRAYVLVDEEQPTG
jgi:kynurenine formamidase